MIKKIFVLLSLLIYWHPSALAQSIIYKEILARPTDHGITVKAFFDATVEVSVQYGTSIGLYSHQSTWQTFAANDAAEISITGLQADKQYFYRLCYRKPGDTKFTTRPEYTFQTKRKQGSSFSFIVQADPHLDEQSDTALYTRCLYNELEDKPDFMIDLGDFLMTDKLRTPAKVVPPDTIIYRCHLLRSYYEKICHSVPLFIALGNHEGEAGWNQDGTANNIAIWGTNYRKKYFANPAPDSFYTGDTTNHKYVGHRENYYAWEWGDALFVVLDPYWYTIVKPDSLNGWRWTLGKTQYDWLKKTLEESKSTFKFVFAHQIIGGDPDGRGGVEYANRYEWGGNNLDGSAGFTKNRPGWYKPIKDLLAENKVNIFFHGHDHFFGKQEKNCIIYQETPQPSHPNYTSAGQAKTYGYLSGQILPNSGHLRVTVSAEGVKVDYLRAYLAKNETTTRHNKDVSATYFIGKKNCYDSLLTGVTVLWNSNYADEIVYPNPFINDTKIEFSLKSQDQLNLNIYDERGTIVKQLIAGSVVPEGKFQVMWDGKDIYGKQLPAGVYWYVVQGKNSGQTRGKLVLLK